MRIGATIILLLVGLSACREREIEKDLPPGYYGPLPSKSGFKKLKELQGKTFHEDGRDWTIGKLVVIPHPETREKAPWVIVECDGEERYLRMQSDEQVLELYEKTTHKPFG